MADKRTRSQQINTWTQTIGIIFAGFWGLYEFVYKEIIAPRSAPVNVSVQLGLQNLGSRVLTSEKESTSMTAVEVTVTATNPSSRTVGLLPSALFVYGHVLGPENPGFDAKLKENAIESGSGIVHSRYETRVTREVLAVGNPFFDDQIKPSETLKRTIVLYVPAKRFQKLTALVTVTSARQASTFDIKWTYDEKDQSFDPKLLRVSADGKPPQALNRDASGRYGNPEDELEEARARYELALPE